MQMKLELVPVPVSDVDRSKSFYRDQLGFVEDLDVTLPDGSRIVQLTPPGSRCSILVSAGLQEISDMPPGALKQLHLVVPQLEECRDELRDHGVDTSDITDVGGGVRYVYVADPDGNTWAIQEMAWRTGENY